MTNDNKNKESPNTYDDIYRVINRTINNKITDEHFTSYLKHSFKLRKENI